jgi:hypothetical protein
VVNVAHPDRRIAVKLVDVDLDTPAAGQQLEAVVVRRHLGGRASGDEQSYVNGLLAAGGSGTTFALEATLGDSAGGPESFLI